MKEGIFRDSSDSDSNSYAPDERLMSDDALPSVVNSKRRRLGKCAVTLGWVSSIILSALLGSFATSKYLAMTQLDIGGDIQNIIPRST
jgi:hypothetical protein